MECDWCLKKIRGEKLKWQKLWKISNRMMCFVAASLIESPFVVESVWAQLSWCFITTSIKICISGRWQVMSVQFDLSLTNVNGTKVSFVWVAWHEHTAYELYHKVHTYALYVDTCEVQKNLKRKKVSFRKLDQLKTDEFENSLTKRNRIFPEIGINSFVAFLDDFNVCLIRNDLKFAK